LNLNIKVDSSGNLNIRADAKELEEKVQLIVPELPDVEMIEFGNEL
jgi:hypothetical protein